jgi:lipoprotein-anchoring transpeptidase ErfK/SrfK
MRPVAPQPTMPFGSYVRSQIKRSRVPPFAWLLLFGAAGTIVMMAGCMFIALLALTGTYASGNVLPGVVVQGTGINQVDIGGLAPEAAAAKLNDVATQGQITLKDESRTWTVSTSDLGIKLDADATASQAMQVGRTDNNVIDGLNIMMNGGEVTPIYTIDLAKAGDTLQQMASQMNVAYSTTTKGRTLNVGATLDKIPGDVMVLLTSGELPVVMDIIDGPRTEYTVQTGEELAIIAKKFNVDMNDIIKLNDISDANMIYPGQKLIIPAAGIWQPTEKDAPPAPRSTGKSIVVALDNQRIYAYENGHLVHSSLMSSGRVGNETVLGDFKIYVKYVTTRMRGPDYDIPDVPWTMYFYQGYGIHGAYWHNTFGRVRSHGCVNLDTDEAKWFFDFAPVGTTVRVLQSWSPPV